MPCNTRSETVSRLSDKPATCMHTNKTGAVPTAVEQKLRGPDEALPFRERLRRIQDRILARAATELEADKAFYEELSSGGCDSANQ